MKKISLVFAAALAVVLMVLPFDTAEAGNWLVQCTGLDCNYCTMIGTLRAVVSWLAIIAAVLAAIVLMFGGFKMVTSAGNESGYQDGKKYVYNAVLGLVILLAAFTLVDVVIQTLVRGEGQFQNIRAGMWWQPTQCGAMSNTRTRNPLPIDADDSPTPGEDDQGGGDDQGADPIDMNPNTLPQGCTMSVQCMTAECAGRGGVWNAEAGMCDPQTGSDPTDPPPPTGCQGVLIQGICYGEVITAADDEEECDLYDGFFSSGVCYRATQGDPTDPTTPDEPVVINQSWVELCQLSCDDEVARCGTEGGFPEIITDGFDRVSCVISSVDGVQ